MRIKSYLSWSQLNTYEQGQYITRYLRDVKLHNKYLSFGKAFHEALLEDSKDKNIEQIKLLLPEYKKREFQIGTIIEKIPLFGILDGLNIQKREFGDFKTSKGVWTQAMTDKSGQITFYWILLWKKYGWFPKRAFIHWVETTEINGQVCLTGKVRTFETQRTLKDLLLFYIRMKNAWEGIEKLCDEELSKTIK